MERVSNVRKGAWTEEEDLLLRKCIDKYGPEKWHQIPIRAGLNRCRKSCRLRWLNYLRPNINRGKFTQDEFDLILRLHKLLGNRWSLIAGRLPGRTANDVKNYWNTNMNKRTAFEKQHENNNKAHKAVKVNPIKPQTRTFSKQITNLVGESISRNNSDDNLSKQSSTDPPPPSEENLLRFESWLVEEEEKEEGKFLEGLVAKTVETAPIITELEEMSFEEQSYNGLDDFSFDMEDLWNLITT